MYWSKIAQNCFLCLYIGSVRQKQTDSIDLSQPPNLHTNTLGYADGTFDSPDDTLNNDGLGLPAGK